MSGSLPLLSWDLHFLSLLFPILVSHFCHFLLLSYIHFFLTWFPFSGFLLKGQKFLLYYHHLTLSLIPVILFLSSSCCSIFNWLNTFLSFWSLTSISVLFSSAHSWIIGIAFNIKFCNWGPFTSKLLLVRYMLTIYIISILLYSFSLTLRLLRYILPSWSSFLICSTLLILLTVFSMVYFTSWNTVVLQNINRLFSFSSFNTKGSSLQVSIFFLTAAFWFTLNLAVLVNIVLLYSPLSSEFGLIFFLNLSLFDCLTFLLFDFRVFFFVCTFLYLSLAYVI